MKVLTISLLVVAAVLGVLYWLYHTKFWPFVVLTFLFAIAFAIRDAIHEHDGKVYARGARKERKRREDRP